MFFKMAKEFGKKIQSKRSYTIVDKKSDNSDYEDVVTLNIKICNVDSNPMANIPFYDPKTLELCDITKTSIDKALPCNEVMSYVYKYDSNEDIEEAQHPQRLYSFLLTQFVTRIYKHKT